MTVRIIHADCRDAVHEMADNSIDSCVTDPPYALISTLKRFGNVGRTDSTMPKAGPYARASAGFMGQKWDTGETAFDPAFWAEVLRVLKPGSHLIAFGGTRTYHRLACAIEDAGFEIRDQLQWLYGSGFPKSHDLSKALDKHLGHERTKVRVDASEVRNPKATGAGRDGTKGATRPWIESAMERGYHEAVSDEAVDWQGWGTALKPACEPIVLARKPLSEKSIAANVLKWGTGALNIDASRVAADTSEMEGRSGASTRGLYQGGIGIDHTWSPADGGRWPANVLHDGSDEVLAAFPDAPGQLADASTNPDRRKTQTVYGALRAGRAGEASADSENDGSVGFKMKPGIRRGDEGSAARFFYAAKADADDRAGSKHPTVKPTDLMRWLVRLITPPGGTVLDPFCGTGSTLLAADQLQFNAVGIEREAQFVADAREKFTIDCPLFTKESLDD